MTHRWLLAAGLALTLVGAARAAPPAAIFTDPPADAAHPARMEVLHIPTGGVEVNGIAYIPSGAGPHPTVVLFHGLPGNEKNLDLAQAIRRAGWTVVTLNYRGSWGSPGTFSFKGNLEDGKAALAYARDPANAVKLQIDPRRLVVIGHSMGGWVTALTAGSDPGVLGAVMISAADMGMASYTPLSQRLDIARNDMESLAGVTADSMAQEVGTLGPYTFAAAAPGLAKLPLFVLTSDDGLAPMSDALVTTIRKAGGKVTTLHVATDHGWNSARIRLEMEILNWLATLPK
ncbi:alpha/beta hydrolase [Phenylobacterium sp.]|uniref:alpha/beta hydrolase family protein n=1 Tax=Phenylobacterium sp. TaxID=1871053 RepID=UPI0025E9CD0F|nr:alpha/beta hydrolase [Phenylobacterium sp.]